MKSRIISRIGITAKKISNRQLSAVAKVNILEENQNEEVRLEESCKNTNCSLQCSGESDGFDSQRIDNKFSRKRIKEAIGSLPWPNRLSHKGTLNRLDLILLPYVTCTP